MFQTNHGYQRQCRPLLRVPCYPYPLISQSSLNDHPQNDLPYPTQRVESDYTTFYWPPAHDNRPSYTRYMSENWEDGGRRSPSSYRYGTKIANLGLATSSSCKHSNLAYPRVTTLQSSMAPAASSISKRSNVVMIYPQVSAAQGILNCTQSRMPSTQSGQLQTSATESNVAQGSRVSTPQSFETLVSVAQSVVEQSSMTHSETAQSCSVNLENTKDQTELKQISSEQFQCRIMGPCRQQISPDRQYSTTQASVTECRKDISTYPPRNQVGLPEISMAQPGKVGTIHAQKSVDPVKQSSASKIKQQLGMTHHIEASSYPKRTRALITPPRFDETSNTLSSNPLRPPPVLRIAQASLIQPEMSQAVEPVLRVPKPSTRHPSTPMTQSGVPSTITSPVTVARPRMSETTKPPPVPRGLKISSLLPCTFSTTSPPVPAGLKTSSSPASTFSTTSPPVPSGLKTSSSPPSNFSTTSLAVPSGLNTSSSPPCTFSTTSPPFPKGLKTSSSPPWNFLTTSPPVPSGLKTSSSPPCNFSATSPPIHSALKTSSSPPCNFSATSLPVPSGLKTSSSPPCNFSTTSPPVSSGLKTSSSPPCNFSTTSPPPPRGFKTSITDGETAMTNPTIHRNLPASSTPPGMLERLPNFVQYPASTSYCKYSKANSNPPTPVPEKSSKKLHFSGSSNKTQAQCYQPYANITKGEAQPQNNNHAKMSVGNSPVGSRSLKRNRWDVKDVKFVKSSKYGREMKVDCTETSRPLYNNESNSNSLFGNNNHKTEKTIVKLECGDSDPSSYVKSNEKPVHSPSDALLNTVKAECDDEDSECVEISEKKENYIDEYLSDGIDVVDDDDAGDDLNDKDADELLMSMSNRSIKINRLLEEQKRLMATVCFVKHTPLVDDQSGYTL